MAIIIHTNTPSRLLVKIRTNIKNRESKEWEMDSDGDFTLTSLSFNGKAWLHVVNEIDDKIVIAIYGRKDEKMTKGIYSIYHCRFSEFLLNSFDTDITNINITAMPTTYDSI